MAVDVAMLYESIDEAFFWIKDAKGRFVWANRRFHMALNRTRAEVIGLSDFDLNPAIVAIRFRFDDEKVLKGHRIVDRLELADPGSKDAQWLQTSKMPIRDRRGRIVGTMGST